MWLGEAVWLTLAVAGVAVVAQAFGVVFTVLRYVGAAYLLFLAWKMWSAPAALADDGLPAGQRPWRMFAAGLLVTLARGGSLAEAVAEGCRCGGAAARSPGWPPMTESAQAERKEGP